MEKNCKKLFLLSVFLLTCSILFSDIQKIKYFQVDSDYSYQIDLLKLILEKTKDEFGEAKAVTVNTKMTMERGLSALEKDSGVDIAFMPANRDYEKTFRAVKFPIMQGLLGFNVFMIKEEKVPEFNSVNILLELNRKMTAGFGKNKTGIEILRHNRIPLDDSEYINEKLYKMLDSGSFDYLPVGLCEAWPELVKLRKKYPGLTIDRKSGFYYPCPVYFFVNKDNKYMAGRIRKGLETVYSDGSMKELFFSHFKNVTEQAEPERRNYFRLENPMLSENTPDPDTSWWKK